MVIPGRGWTAAGSGTGAATDFLVLGPFAPEDYIRLLTVAVYCDGNGTLNLALSLGASEEASREAVERGMPIISRSDSYLGSVPMFGFHVGGHVGANLWIPVGIKGSVGARYIIAECEYVTDQVRYSVMLGVEVLRFGKGPKVAGEK